jgi:hypothetical protein
LTIPFASGFAVMSTVDRVVRGDLACRGCGERTADRAGQPPPAGDSPPSQSRAGVDRLTVAQAGLVWLLVANLWGAVVVMDVVAGTAAAIVATAAVGGFGESVWYLLSLRRSFSR